MNYCLKGGRLIDPAGRDCTMDILVVDGKINRWAVFGGGGGAAVKCRRFPICCHARLNRLMFTSANRERRKGDDRLRTGGSKGGSPCGHAQH